MKLKPEHIKKNIVIEPMKVNEYISHDKYYEQFDHCPTCGKFSDGPLTGHNDEDYYHDIIEYRRCRNCLITWKYKRYYNISDDPSYQAYIKSKENSLTPTTLKPRIETVNEGCVVWILLGAGIAAIIAGGFIL